LRHEADLRPLFFSRPNKTESSYFPVVLAVRFFCSSLFEVETGDTTTWPFLFHASSVAGASVIIRLPPPFGTLASQDAFFLSPIVLLFPFFSSLL